VKRHTIAAASAAALAAFLCVPVAAGAECGVRVNDRGPFVAGRILDLPKRRRASSGPFRAAWLACAFHQVNDSGADQQQA
jgi:hypothetical protein